MRVSQLHEGLLNKSIFQLSNDIRSSGPKDQFIRHSEQCWTGSEQEANRKFSYVAAAHARSTASPKPSGGDFSLSGATHTFMLDADSRCRDLSRAG